MVKTKHQKSKPHKALKVKQHGKQADLTLFRGQLDGLGLKIIQVTADGNCFFRSLADQLAGHEDEHEIYRSMVVQYIRIDPQHLFDRKIVKCLSPFSRMMSHLMNTASKWRKMGHGRDTWSCRQLPSLQIATYAFTGTRHLAGIFRISIDVELIWFILSFSRSYHDEEHYNSVRAKEDPCDGPARLIVIKADVALSQGKVSSGKSIGLVSGDVTDSGSIKIVMGGSGCEDITKVEEVLLQVHGDVGAAIEYLIAERESDDYSVNNGSLSCQAGSTSENQGDGDGNCKEGLKELSKKTSNHEPSGSPVKETTKDGISKTDAKIPRNKVCPCGSKKKYKSCCGTAKGRSSSAKIISNQTTEIGCGSGRKDKKQSKKGAHLESLPSCRSGNGQIDMGALCI